MAVPRLVRSASTKVRSRIMDSTRWDGYHPRADDVIIATYPKCGTTWMQRIVSMLIFATDETMPVLSLSPWLDARIFGPIEGMMAAAEAQTHRRFLKSHMPLDALPLYDEVKYIHVARDGRDAAMSLHNHFLNFTEGARAMISEISLNDPKFGDPLPPTPSDPAIFFQEWINEDDGHGDARGSFFNVENSFWREHHRPNILHVHYGDLKADREGEIKRIAKFLEIDLPDTLWPRAIEAVGFDAMKRQGDELIPEAKMLWQEGSSSFLNKGTNGRWRDAVRADDLKRYDEKVKAEFSPPLARWVEHGRLVAGDPKQLPD
ncbi:MAG: sulfotransferase domain-containing protein [Alphaproteobacteria bacterium]|nr:sulfotransferase domain-containing protein [Alphaproteobacteria bacterium]